MFEKELEQLKARYGLSEWTISIEVVPESALERDQNAAEVRVREPYRSATIYLLDELVSKASPELIREVLEHEVQHIFLNPLEALRSLVLDAVEPNMRTMFAHEFARTNERVRASLERLIAT